MKEPKGMSLEREFSVWMKSHLGYTKTKLRLPVKGKIADRAYEVDIYAEKYSRMWDTLQRLGIIILILSGFTYFFPLYRETQALRRLMEDLVGQISPAWVGSAVFIVGIAALLLAYAGKRKITMYAWVECKDTKTNVKRASVQKLAMSVQDVRDNITAKWKPDVVILVSGTDFDADALNFAREHRFICYRRSGSTFEEVD